jgi:hypothetical protein
MLHTEIGASQKSMNNAYLTTMFKEAQETSRKIESAFGGFDVTQLNWQEAPNRWSVGQCLDHLIITNQHYLPQFKEIAEGKKRSTSWERLPLLPWMFGSILSWTVRPDTQIKIKTFRGFQPRQGNIPTGIVRDFGDHIDGLLELISSTDWVDHERVLITSPVAHFITYNLKYAVTILITHLELHHRQALHNVELDDFPLV